MASALDMSPFEQKATIAFQTLTQTRMQCNVMHESVRACIEKCIEPRELFTSRRATAPIKQRISTDEEEKRCVSVCSSKWDEFYRREAMQLNQRETTEVQQKAMMEMMSRAGVAK